MDLRFETKDVTTAIFSDGKTRVSRRDVRSTLKWTVELECRDWGIKMIIPHLSVLATKWTEEDYTLGIEDEKEMTLDFASDSQWQVNWRGIGRNSHFPGFSPIEVEIDIDKKIVMVDFE